MPLFLTFALPRADNLTSRLEPPKVSRNQAEQVGAFGMRTRLSWSWRAARRKE